MRVLFKMFLVLMKKGSKKYEFVVKKTYKSSLTSSREPRGFGFVQFVDPVDAADAKYEMDGYVLLGRELTVVFAEENRKKPSEMRARERVRGRSYDRRRSPLCYSRSPRCRRSYSRSPDYSPRHYHSRSMSPMDRSRSYRDRSYSRSPYRSTYGSRSQSRSPYGSRGRSRSRSVASGYSRWWWSGKDEGEGMECLNARDVDMVVA